LHREVDGVRVGFCFVILCCISAKADTIAPLQWTGDPVVDSCQTTVFSSCFGLAIPDANGITTAFSSIAFGQENFISYAIERPFTVTVGGDFELTNSVTLQGNGEICGPSGICGAITASFDANGLTGTAIKPNDPSLDPMMPAVASASSSSLVFFAPGDYTLSQGMDATVFAANDPTISLVFSTDLSPVEAVPEPRGYVQAVLVVCLALMIRARPWAIRRA
jgi:hypothetical protein